jgi:hypothetical protein
MGAKKHHFIPQFLLREFASRNSGPEHYCWHFRRGAKPCEANIKGIGQQRNFHGDVEVENLEGLIANRESVYADLVHTLRTSTITIQNIPLIEEFIVHLIIRGRNLRQGFTKATDDLLSAMVAHFQDSRNHRKRNDLIFEYMKKLPEFNAWLTLVPKGKEEIFLRYMRHAMDNVPIEERLRLVSGILKASLQEQTAKAHIKTLSKDLAPTKFIEKIHGLNWRLLKYPKASLILGDVGVLFQDSQDQRLKHPIISGPPQHIFLPISHELMLFGTRDNSFEFDVNNINEAQAALSHEFFVSSICTERELTWQLLIGSNSDLISAEEVSELVRSEL